MREWQVLYDNARTGIGSAPRPVFADDGMIRWTFDPAFEFDNAFHYLEVDKQTMQKISDCLDGIEEMSIGGWFYCRRAGEQAFLCRQVPITAPDSERVFTPGIGFVDFLLGTDQHGFLMGNINGNGRMPFPHVTVNELFVRQWHQVVITKDAEGHHRFYQNGILVHSDHNHAVSGYKRPFIERLDVMHPPIRMAMPMGGLMGEVWICPRRLSDEWIRRDFEAKKAKYQPIKSVKPIDLREMNIHPATDLWQEEITWRNWPEHRQRIYSQIRKQFGTDPNDVVALDSWILEEQDMGGYIRRKISIAVEKDDRMVFYLLVPKDIRKPVPAILCMHGHFPSGKNCVVGIEGTQPGTPPDRNQSYAIDMVQAGYVALAPDYLRAGERIKPDERHGEATSFDAKHPEWSIPGKDIWDTSRAIDYLETLDFVDAQRIGATGHSYGGSNTIITTAFDPRIKAAVSNGPTANPSTYHHELAALIAPRPLLVGQAVGERRLREEAIYAALIKVYTALGCRERVYYHWYPGDHDYPPQARKAAVEWFKRWLE